jgi:hypothetical protein
VNHPPKANAVKTLFALMIQFSSGGFMRPTNVRSFAANVPVLAGDPDSSVNGVGTRIETSVAAENLCS